MGLTNAEQQFYEANGYFLKKGLVSSEDIAKIQEEIQDIHNRMAEQPTDGYRNFLGSLRFGRSSTAY